MGSARDILLGFLHVLSLEYLQQQSTIFQKKKKKVHYLVDLTNGFVA